jgi:hypothetical protein
VRYVSICVSGEKPWPMDYGSGSEAGAFRPCLSAPFRGTVMRSASCTERHTATPFLERWRPQDAAAPEDVRDEEPWTGQTEALLLAWSRSWDRRAAAHGAAEKRARRGHLMLQIPTVLIPIVLAPILAAKLLDETNAGVAVALVLSGRAPTPPTSRADLANKTAQVLAHCPFASKVSPVPCRQSLPLTGKVSSTPKRPTSTTTCSRTPRRCSPRARAFGLAVT